MAEKPPTERIAPVRELAGDNAWIVPVLGLGLAIAAFVLDGWKSTIVVVILLLIAGNVVFGRSWLRARRMVPVQPSREAAAVDADTGGPDAEEPHAGQPSELPPIKESKSSAGDDDADAADPTVDIADPPWREVLDAAFDRDVVRTIAAVERFVEEADTEREKLTRQAWGLRMRSVAGDVRAIAELELLVTENPNSPDPALSLAESLEALSEYGRAVAVLEQAAKDVREHPSPLLSEASRIIRVHGDKERARSLAAEALSLASDDLERAKAHAAMGWAWWEDDQKFAAFTAWENALRANPTDDRLRFAAAYRYADTDLEELAMWHYEVLIARSPMHPFARNNLGIVLTNLNMNRPGFVGGS